MIWLASCRGRQRLCVKEGLFHGSQVCQRRVQLGLQIGMIGEEGHVRDDLAGHPPSETVNGDCVRPGSAARRVVDAVTISVSGVARAVE
jgi:hypothetical protein